MGQGGVGKNWERFDDARTELDRLDRAGALAANTVMIHGVGLTPIQRARAIEQEAALVGCPSSNLFMLDAVASVSDFAAAHRLALGSDSRLTGERDLLDEARVALATAQISGDGLLRAITSDAAKILRLDDVARLDKGMRADLLILPGTNDSPAGVLGKIRRSDLRAVIRDGVIQVADPDFAPFMQNPVSVTLDGTPKRITPELAARISVSTISEPGLVIP